jgi:hypothetical protein
VFDGGTKHFASVRDAEAINIPFLSALADALLRCPSLIWLAKPRSGRLALHPASTAQKRTIGFFRIPKLKAIGAVTPKN